MTAITAASPRCLRVAAAVVACLALPGSTPGQTHDPFVSPSCRALPTLPERDCSNVPREELPKRPSEASVRAALEGAQALAASVVPESVVFDEPGDGAIWVLGRSYKARVDSAGLTYIPFFGSQAPRNFPVAFRLRSASIGGEGLPLAGEAPPVRDGERIYVVHGSVTEVLDFALDSVEQSFVVDRDDALGALDLALDVETELTQATDAGGTRFESPVGAVRYGLPTTFDAVGQELSTRSVPLERGLQFTISADEVARASGDLTIDPVIATLTVDTSLLDDRDPDVAYDATNDRYIVVYERVYSQTDHDVLCQMLQGGTAQPIAGSWSYIDFTSGDWRQPSVANMNGDDLFLVAASVGPWPEVIKCRTRSAASTAMGSQVTLTSPSTGYGTYCYAPDYTRHFTPVVGGDTYPGSGGRFCVVWICNNIADVGGFYVVGPSIHACPTVLMCTVTASGVASPPKLLYDFGYYGPAIDSANWASLAISKSNGDPYSGNQDWNVVWQGLPSLAYDNIMGARVHWNGTVTYSPTILLDNQMPIANIPWPPAMISVSSSESNWTRRFLVTWHANFPGSPPRLYGMLVDPSIGWGFQTASTLYDLTQLQGNPGPQWQPAVDCDGANYVVGFNGYPGGTMGLAASEFGFKYHKFYGWQFVCVEQELQAQVAISNFQMGRARICAEASGLGLRRNALIGGTNWAGYGSGGYYIGDPVVGLHAH